MDGRFVQALRLEYDDGASPNGLSASALAKRLDVSEGTVRNAEAGDGVTEKTWNAYTTFFGLSREELAPRSALRVPDIPAWNRLALLTEAPRDFDWLSTDWDGINTTVTFIHEDPSARDHVELLVRATDMSAALVPDILRARLWLYRGSAELKMGHLLDASRSLDTCVRIIDASMQDPETCAIRLQALAMQARWSSQSPFASRTLTRDRFQALLEGQVSPQHALRASLLWRAGVWNGFRSEGAGAERALAEHAGYMTGNGRRELNQLGNHHLGRTLLAFGKQDQPSVTDHARQAVEAFLLYSPTAWIPLVSPLLADGLAKWAVAPSHNALTQVYLTRMLLDRAHFFPSCEGVSEVVFIGRRVCPEAVRIFEREPLGVDVGHAGAHLGNDERQRRVTWDRAQELLGPSCSTDTPAALLRRLSDAGVWP